MPFEVAIVSLLRGSTTAALDLAPTLHSVVRVSDEISMLEKLLSTAKTIAATLPNVTSVKVADPDTNFNESNGYAAGDCILTLSEGRVTISILFVFTIPGWFSSASYLESSHLGYFTCLRAPDETTILPELKSEFEDLQQYVKLVEEYNALCEKDSVQALRKNAELTIKLNQVERENTKLRSQLISSSSEEDDKPTSSVLHNESMQQSPWDACVDQLAHFNRGSLLSRAARDQIVAARRRESAK